MSEDPIGFLSNNSNIYHYVKNRSLFSFDTMGYITQYDIKRIMSNWYPNELGGGFPTFAAQRIARDEAVSILRDVGIATIFLGVPLPEGLISRVTAAALTDMSASLLSNLSEGESIDSLKPEDYRNAIIASLGTLPPDEVAPVIEGLKELLKGFLSDIKSGKL
jgi:hypothetical protein